MVGIHKQAYAMFMGLKLHDLAIKTVTFMAYSLEYSMEYIKQISV